jgi:hypothetical protein
MKKTLVAIAALASVSAFAQTTVTIDGGLDAGYQSIKYKYPKFYYNKYLFQKYTLNDMNMLDKIKDKIGVLQNIINYEHNNIKQENLCLMQG